MSILINTALRGLADEYLSAVAARRALCARVESGAPIPPGLGAALAEAAAAEAGAAIALRTAMETIDRESRARLARCRRLAAQQVAA